MSRAGLFVYILVSISTNNNLYMKAKETNRNDYQTPGLKVIEIKARRVICQSGGTDQYTNTDDPNWFSAN